MSKAKSVLLVDDDRNVAELMLLALEEANLAVEFVVASDGVEALDYLFGRGQYHDVESSPPVVVLLDLNMPKVSGLEVLQQIRRDERLGRVPVVMLTSSSDIKDLEDCYHNGANAYVVKPVEFQQFKSTIQKLARFWTAINQPPPVPARSAVTSLTA